MVRRAEVSSPVASARPVVKWAGGKRALLDRLLPWVPRTMNTYAEPFCGGGALFFRLASEEKRRFKRAILADKNSELVACYHAIQRDLGALVAKLASYQDEHLSLDAKGREAHYYRMRDAIPERLSVVERGARLIFLNKTCFNGLWRVNSAGRFNVPYGRYESPRILDEETLQAAARALSGVEVHERDFSEVTSSLGKGDFVYFDPPYVPVSRTANFTAYAKDRFGEREQQRLADLLATLHQRGVRSMLSNTFSPETEALYKRWKRTKVPVRRAINSDPSKRGEVNELIVRTYDPVTFEPISTRTTKTKAAS